jgi:uncharacterized protein YjbI with pentapeptide repeats
MRKRIRRARVYRRLRFQTVIVVVLGLLAGILVPVVVGTTVADADTPTWTELSCGGCVGSPPALEGPSMAYDAATGQLLLVGAVPGDTDDETWLFDDGSWRQLFPATSPSARSQASMAYSATSSQLVLFGGTTTPTDVVSSSTVGDEDTWTWTGSTWVNQTSTACAVPLPCPSARFGASIADSSEDGLVLFGGQDGTTSLDDTWVWDGRYWFPTSTGSPEGRYGAAMAEDPDTGTIILHSGFNALNDTEAWNPGTESWSFATDMEDNGPHGGASFFYDPNTDQMILFGGESTCCGSLSSETLDYTGSEFEALSPGTSPPAREDAAMAYDPAIDAMVLFGGDTGFSSPTVYNDTWIYGSPQAAVTASLSTSAPTVAGVETVPASSLPTSDVTDGSLDGSASSDPASAPLSSIPLHSIGLASSPLHSIPLSSIPLHSIALGGHTGASGLAAAADTLDSTLLSDLTIDFPPGCSGVSCTGWEGVLAGTPYENVPLEGVTLADVLDNATAAANFDEVDLGAVDLSSSTLGSVPLSTLELGAVPLSSLDLDGASDSAGALSNWCSELATLGSSCAAFGIGQGASSTTVTPLSLALAGVPLSSIPLSSIPLSSIPLSSIPLSSIPLSSISLSSSPLSSIPLSSIPLSSIPLSSIPLSSIPLHSIPLSSIPLSSIPLSSIPLHSIPLSSIPLSSIPLHSIPLSSIPLSSIGLVVNCAAFASLCSGSDETLGQALAAGALQPTATLGDLGTYGTTTLGELGTYGTTTLGELGTYGTTTLGELGTYGSTTVGQLLEGDDTTADGYPSLSLDDLLSTTVPPSSYQWQDVDLSSLPLAADESTGGTVNYDAQLNVSVATSQVDVSVTLPSGFAYVPGSSELSSVAVADPIVTAQEGSGTALSWTLPAVPTGSSSLTFSANAGIGLGPVSTSLTASIPDAITPPASASTSVDVVDGEEPQVSSATTALPLGPGTFDTTPTTQGNLTIGYLTSPGDVNDWTVSVPQGAELSVALTNLPATYDLELFGPQGQQLQGTPDQTISGVTDTIPSLTPASTTEATPGSQDLPVTPPPGDQLEAVSNNPDAQSQYLQTTPLGAGTYVIQVSGYNDAYSSSPYLLQANVLGGGASPSCPGGLSYASALASAPAATGSVSIPAGTNTLFLVSTQRLTAAFSSSATSTIMNDLGSVASDSSAGVVGAVVPVDSYASVQAAYATWDADPCSVSAANAVVAAISAVVDQIRANDSTIQNVVIVGADDQIPFARLADGTTDSNERDYGASSFTGENNVEADALSEGYYFSDDPYVSSNPLGVGSATLYSPQLAVGRLVESPAQIESALTRFVSSDGDLDATASLTTGYSFLTSGAQAVSANLAANGLAASTLINETWQSSDLDAGLAAKPTPGVVSINAHFDYSRALPAYDNTNNSTANLFTTSDVRTPPSADATSYAGRLLFSMGCHSGLDVSDAEVSVSGVTTPVDDWAKTFADSGALWVGNTGYGYADTDTVAYSAKLMSGFAADLNGSLTIGEALSAAKQSYAAGEAIVGPYDLKALMESTLYGLPMYHLNSPGTPVSVASGPSTVSNPIPGASGLTGAPVQLSLGSGSGSSTGQLSLITTANGRYYEVKGSTPGTQVTEYRPIEPLDSVPATEPGLVAHGALITSLSSTDISNFTPVYSEPAVGASDAIPADIGDAAFPGTLQRVATYGTFTSTGTGQAAQLDLIAGQFLPSASDPGTGIQRLFNSIGADVLYDSPGSALADDYTPPTIDVSTASASASGVTFEVQTTASSAADPVADVVVLSTDARNPGVWQEATLSSSDGSNWSATVPPTASGQVQYIVQAVDQAGNVAVSDNEGVDFNANAAPALSISLSGPGPVNGSYTGPVTASVTGPSGTTYTLDGSQPAAVPSGGIVVSGSGAHTLTVNDPSGDVSTQAFSISTTQTITSLTSAPDPSTVGQQVGLVASVAAATAHAPTPTGNVEFLVGTTPVAGCGGSSGVPLSGGTATCPLTPTSPATDQITADYLGSSTFSPSSSAPALVQTVDLATVTVSLGSSANPAATNAPVVYTATVGPAVSGIGNPTGYVEFLDGPTPISSCGGASGVALTSAASATCSVSYSSSGSHSITAVYLGDTDYQGPVTSMALGEKVGKSSSTVGLSGGPNPVSPGVAVTYLAKVAVVAPAVNVPTGFVEFLDGGTPISSCGGSSGVALGSSTSASCVVTYSAAGPHTITASYLGDANTAGSTSLSLTETVNSPVTATVTALSSSKALSSPASVGLSTVKQAVTFTAKTTSTSGTVTGSVEFLNGSTPVSGCGGSTGVALSSGTATCTVTFSATGLDDVVAHYLGSAKFTASSSSTEFQIVSPYACSVLAGCDLVGLNLSGVNLAGANLSGTDLQSTNLTGADLAGSTISGDYVYGANLTNANLTSAIAVGTDFQQATLTGADLVGANLNGALFYEATMPNANLTSVAATKADFQAADLAGADLAQATLTSAIFVGADLASATMTSVSASGADLQASTMTSVSAVGANFSSGTLIGVNLTKANLTNANLSHADLANSTLTGTILTGANTTGAIL